MTLDIPVYGERVVCNVGVWHIAHPIDPKSACPAWAEAVSGAGVGGADSLANAAKFTMSELMSEAEPVSAPVVGSVMFVVSSGVPLKTQPGTAERSLGKSSLLTPISTL